jgi:hypothetical protein
MPIEAMPWGKHKGERIDSLPSSYLKWLAENVSDENKGDYSVCLAADKEYQDRSNHGGHFDEVESGGTEKIKCPHCGKFFNPK